jgi:hypothetical protein
MLAVATAVNAAPSKELRECVEASEDAQRLRDELHFKEAKQKLLRCSDERCPAVVQSDCAKWLSLLQTDQPSVVIATRVGGQDLFELPAVEVDGVPAGLGRLGQPLELDPGPHRVLVRLADGRVQTEALVLGVGEKNRRVLFAFAAPPVVEPGPTAVATPALSQAAPVRSAVLPAVVTGAAVAAGVTFGVLAGLGRSSLSGVEGQACAAARSCDPALLSPTRSFYLGADISAAVGLALVGLATWLWWGWAEAAPLALTPRENGGQMAWQF